MTEDKPYSVEGRHAALVTQLGTGAYPSTDGNNYDITRLTLVLPSNFSIVHTAPADTIFSHALGTANYEVKVWAVTQNVTAADAAGFAWAFTGTASGLVDFESVTTGTAVIGYAASSTITTQFNGQGVAGNQKLEANLTIFVTAAGTLSFTGKQLVGGNNVTVFGGSRMRICRIVAT